MYISISLKNPPVTLVAKGALTEDYCKEVGKALGGGILRCEASDGLPMLIPVSIEANVAYIKEITEETFQKMEEDRKKKIADQNASIVRPDVTMRPPGRGFRKH